MRRSGCSAVLTAALVLVALPALAQQMVPADLQVPLLLKVLDYDRKFVEKVGKELMIGIVYDANNADSRKVTDEISGILQKYKDQRKTVRNVPISFIQVIYRSGDELKKTIEKYGIRVVYLAPGFTDQAVKDMSLVCRELGRTTVTGVRKYMDNGIAVGVAKSPVDPKIFVNVATSKSESSEFNASLLRLAQIVR